MTDLSGWGTPRQAPVDTDARQRRAAGALVFLGGLVLLVTVMVAAPYPPCTEAAPCGPERAGNVLIGLLLSTVVAGWLGLRFAAGVGVVTAIALVGFTLARPLVGPPLWSAGVAVAYVAGCVLLHRRAVGRSRVRRPRSAERQPVPPIRWSVRPPLAPTLAAVALLGAGVAVALWVAYAQDRADARQAAATVVTGTVRSHPDEATVELALPDGSTTRIGVFGADDHPVGGPFRLAVDDRGLRQPLSEPYDLTPWLSLATLLGVLGIGGSAPAATALASRWRFTRRPQPTSEVVVEFAAGVVRLRRRAMDELPFGEVPIRPESGLPGGRRRDAILHGVPVYGRWCTVTVDGRTLSPRAPLRAPAPPRPARDRQGAPAWPALHAVEIIATVAAVLAATVFGIRVSDVTLTGLFDLLCTADRCQPVALAVVGWSTVGGTMVLAGLIYRHARPGRPALYALIGCVVLLAFALTLLFAGGGPGEDPPPGAGALRVGLLAGLAPLLIGGVGGSPSAPRRGRGRPEPAESGRPLLLVNIGQGITLTAVVLWAALFG
ncbi:hypothetical protein [Micromonospora endolithica]|uniref:Uncharacterized protein n=1 Tax=Micromonospora endolithica TaxID=230091 RepID=A0A3A9ZQX9_9ACTN|nr:hypothetical protein [Micromonospora endolithica]RKN50619.1 hypothetical protein D7223_02275 [Micromonospora endolithica]TWJ20657.1 hypothetical protein JD76_00756 [Micromonospora endolithica]